MMARLNAEAGTRLWVGASPIALCDLCTGVFKEARAALAGAQSPQS
jgi:hypothetical protein